MDNIFKLQEIVGEYVKKKLAENYSFELWKDTLVADRNEDDKSISKIWSFFSGKFNVAKVIADVSASQDEWCPCLVIEFNWNIKSATIVFRVTLVKDHVQFVQVVDMMGVSEKYGKNFDFAKEFSSKVVMLDSLK